MSSHRAPRVYSIPPGVPYLSTFAKAFLDGEIVPGFGAHVGPLRLASATIYVPTRRAARALAADFAALSTGPVTFLPRIVPLGQLDAIETSLMFDEGADWRQIEELPEAIGELPRRLDLARLILQWGRSLRSSEGDAAPLIAPAPAHAWQLAGDLAGLMDEMTIEGVPWDRLDRLTPDEFDIYWKLTLRFLKIATTTWPDHLAEIGLMDRAERQVRLVEAEIARWDAKAGDDPVVAIGSTGTNRATARLLAALARAPNGAVVLPGLDVLLDETSWSLIPGSREQHIEPSAGHPQAMLHRLLSIIGIGRDEVTEIGIPNAALQARRKMLSEALRPADTTDRWQSFHDNMPPGSLALALEQITLVEAADDREEALAIAILMREALEGPGRTASLVTPDRALASRVRAELARWNIDVDDSGGERLSATSEGALACLLLTTACEPKPGLSLLALMTHPLFRLGRESAEVERLARLLDIAVLRTILPDTADARELIEAARKAAETRDAHPAAKRIRNSEWGKLESFLLDLDRLLEGLREAREIPVSDFAVVHREAFAGATRGVGSFSPAAETVIQLFDDLAEGGRRLSLNLADYQMLFEQIASETVVRGPQRSHPRLKILGLLEARLLHSDLMVLGGLDEAVWPPQTSTDAFLNRPMRAELGLSSPERRIGQTAHDFAQLMGAGEVVITRSSKRGGSPTVPSRFLQRLAALAGDTQLKECRIRGERALQLARLIDGEGERGRPCERPRPRPPIDLRPTRLSVTRIETLRRDPYSIYAEYILMLKPLEPIGSEAGVRVAGTILHEVLSKFSEKYPASLLPADAETEIIEAAHSAFHELMRNAEFRAFTWPRHAFALTQFIGWDRSRRADISQILTEQGGKLPLVLADGSQFLLTGTADRIEKRRDGSLHVIDYKSGRVPSSKEVRAGFSPQLTLEAAMIQRGAFETIPPQPVESALYVKLGGAKGIDDRIVRSEKDQTFQDLVDEQFQGMCDLLSQFRLASTAYVPRPYPQFTTSYGAYDHLARVKEWSAGGDGDE